MPASSPGCRASSRALPILCGPIRPVTLTIGRDLAEFVVGRSQNPRGDMSFEEQMRSGMIMADI